MQPENTLRKAGFTQNEVKAYLALLRIGRATSYHLIQEAGISSGKIYETLDRLIGRGLVSSVILRGKKHFEAAEPERLLDYMQKREHETHAETQEIAQIVPQLKVWHRLVAEETRAEMYEGLSGIRTVYELMLREGKAGDTHLILGAPREAGEKLDWYFDGFNRRRIAAGIQLRIILNHAHPREQKLQHLQKTQVRVFPKTVVTPSWIIIFGEYVATCNIAEKAIVFLIKSSLVAKSYRQYFTLMWDMAR